MSSDSRPSFRTYSKNKIKKVLNSNFTSSIRERIISNETYNDLREKSRNLTDTAKDRIDYEKIKNKTKEFIPDRFSFNDNSTSPKGFYDSLFSPQTENDIYLKVAIIALWVIAILCVLSTIITMFVPVTKNRKKTTNTKMIFFHIFLCEFFYLIYILLSMINVGLDFQLNSFWCNIAKYGMYVTIPVMCFALFVLTIERLTSYCNCGASWTRILTNTCITQIILICFWVIWIICIAIVLVPYIFVKKQIVESATDLSEKFVPTRFNPMVGKIFSSHQCSIDGQLSPIFKILFIILFIILIVLVIKAIAVSTMYSLAGSTMYSFIKLSCFRQSEEDQEHIDHHMTLIFSIIVLLNLFFSFPFYFTSAADSITRLIGKDKPYPMKLKITFILRLSSIILQCLIFYTFESNSWGLLSKLLRQITCKKIPGLKADHGDAKRPTPTKHARNSNRSTNNVRSNGNKRIPAIPENNSDTELSIDDESNDDVFIDESRTKPLHAKKSVPKEEVTTDQDDSDDDTKAMQNAKLPVKKKNIPSKLSQKRDEIEEEKRPIKKSTSKHSNTNGTSKQTSNGKATYERISSATTDRKTSKPNTDQNRTKYAFIPHHSSTDDISNASVNSDDKIKPSSLKPKIQPITHSSSNKEKRTPTRLSNGHRSHHQTHRRARSQGSRPRATASNNHNHIETTKMRTKSPSNINNHTEKPKQDRLSKILANSIEV